MTVEEKPHKIAIHINCDFEFFNLLADLNQFPTFKINSDKYSKWKCTPTFFGLSNYIETLSGYNVVMQYLYYSILL